MNNAQIIEVVKTCKDRLVMSTDIHTNDQWHTTASDVYICHIIDKMCYSQEISAEVCFASKEFVLDHLGGNLSFDSFALFKYEPTLAGKSCWKDPELFERMQKARQRFLDDLIGELQQKDEHHERT